jgi:hypothetical protein
MPKIKSLTDKQISRFPFYREKWLKIGLCTDPVDFSKAEDAAKDVYKEVNLSIPDKFYYAQSPLDGVGIARKLLGIKNATHSFTFGAHDASWLSFYDFFLNELNIKNCRRLEPLMKLAEVCGWWIPFDTAVILEDRPRKLVFDNRNLLHNETGPSVEYSDGFSVYSWHGQRIPKKWVEEKDYLTPTIALGLENLEERRVACEILGWDKVLNELDSTTIDKDEDDAIGELLEVNLPDVGKERFLKVLCGTGRIFAIPVPGHVKTALEANSWTYDLDAKDYVPEVRT